MCRNNDTDNSNNILQNLCQIWKPTNRKTQVIKLSDNQLSRT
jgi:hypothetical protein